MDEDGNFQMSQNWHGKEASSSGAKMKSIRSMSEGNFQSCYANNKAEKHRLARISQGIDSCRQAQVAKFRKEKRNLEHLRQTLAIEKSNQKSKLSDQDAPICPNCILKYAGDIDLSSSSFIKKPSKKTKVIGNHNQALYEFRPITPFYLRRGYSHYHHVRKSEDQMESRARRNSDNSHNDSDLPTWKSSSGTIPKSTEKKDFMASDSALAKQVSSFLMTKTLFDKDTGSPTGSSDKVKDEGSREQVVAEKVVAESNVSLDAQQDSIMEIEQDLHDVIPSDSLANFDIEMLCEDCLAELNLLKDGDGEMPTSSELEDTKDGSTLTAQERQLLAKHDKLDPDLDTGERNGLTAYEREQLSKHDRRRSRHLEDISDSDFEKVNTKEPIPAYHDPQKAELLRIIAKNRLKQGDSLTTVAKDKMFDNILEVTDDGRHFPAYNPDKPFTEDDYRALRKCKYVRASDSNITSLKETAISSLIRRHDENKE